VFLFGCGGIVLLEGGEGGSRRGLEWMVLVLGVVWRGEGDCVFLGSVVLDIGSWLN
jgi:hypothetical protein